jgi:predicted DNA-binding protein (UPF0251 family)
MLIMSPFIKRQRLCRRFTGHTFYKPKGIPLSALDINQLELDELEAAHLCDVESLEQEEAAQKMNISRATLQRLLYSGRKKIVDALYESKALEIIRHDHISERR